MKADGDAVAFAAAAALKADGSAVAWGRHSNPKTSCSMALFRISAIPSRRAAWRPSIQEQREPQSIYSTNTVFAALKGDGS